MNISLIKRAFEIGSTEGWLTVARKTYIYYLAKIISIIASNLYPVNSREYWNFRMKFDWNAVGGSQQTSLFAASLFANIDFRKLDKISSFLDYGCATGDSTPYVKIFFPDTKIYLYDLSEQGLAKAIRRYSRFIDVEKYIPNQKYDFVYCSNVIEHVSNPRELVNTLINSSKRYICIQCPWKETFPNGELISPDKTLGEHIWSINDDFFEKFIKDSRVTWEKSVGAVPMAWPGGEQVYYLGKLN